MATDPIDPAQVADEGTDWSIFAGEQTEFGADFPYQNRVVQSSTYPFGKDITPEQAEVIGAQLKWYGMPGGKKTARVYKGEFLVDGQGLIVRAPYDVQADSYNELYGMSDAKRQAVLSLLYSRGFYGTGRPSATGTLGKDRSAFKEFLQYANSKGRTWDVVLANVVADPNRVTIGGGASYRTTPKEDLTEYLRKASLDRLGRTMTKADIDRAVAAIQSQEASKGPQAPATSVMAEQQVVQLNPDQDKAVRFRRGVDLFMGLLGQ
jgi:hypothetical protein